MSGGRKRSRRGPRPASGKPQPGELAAAAPGRGDRALLAASAGLFSLWLLWLLLLALFG